MEKEKIITEYKNQIVSVQEIPNGDQVLFGINKKYPEGNYLGNCPEEISEVMLPLMRKLKIGVSNASSMTLFGSVIGGEYPHPDIQNIRTGNVKQGVYYHPDIAFIARDLIINDKYASPDVFYQLMEYAGIPAVPELLRGSVEDCLCFPDKFDSQIYKEFGLPKLDDNKGLGYYVKLVNGHKTIYRYENRDILNGV